MTSLEIKLGPSDYLQMVKYSDVKSNELIAESALSLCCQNFWPGHFSYFQSATVSVHILILFSYWFSAPTTAPWRQTEQGEKRLAIFKISR